MSEEAMEGAPYLIMCVVFSAGVMLLCVGFAGKKTKRDRFLTLHA